MVSFFGVILVSWIYIASLLTSCKSTIRVPFLVSFLVSYSPFLVSSFALEYHSLSLGCHFGCHSEFSVHLFCLHFRYNVHHLYNLAYPFIVLGFTQSFGVHIIVLVAINPCLYHLSLTIKICSSIIQEL